MEALRDCAPVTAAAVRPPRLLAEREAAERAAASWPEELREFFSLHDGQAFRSEDDQFVGEFLPGSNCCRWNRWRPGTSSVVKCCIRSMISGRIGLLRFGRSMQGKRLRCLSQNTLRSLRAGPEIFSC